MARPEISSGRSGRASFITSATMNGSAMPHAIHIAPSRAIAASVLNFSGKDFRRRIVEQRGQAQIEFGINPEHKSDDKRKAKRDEKSGPVHGAGFSRGR